MMGEYIVIGHCPKGLMFCHMCGEESLLLDPSRTHVMRFVAQPLILPHVICEIVRFGMRLEIPAPSYYS